MWLPERASLQHQHLRIGPVAVLIAILSLAFAADDARAQVVSPTPTPIPTFTPPGTLNHFQCYEVRRVPFVEPDPVSLVNRFGPATVELQRPTRLCNPASRNGEDPMAPSNSDHLLGYKVRQTDPRPARIANVVVENQFGTIVGDLVKPDWLLVPTAKSLSEPPSTPSNAAVDHFTCYKLARFAKTRIEGVRVEDQFGQLTVDVKRPTRVCVPVDKNGEGVLDAETHLACYEVRKTPRLPRFQGPEPIFVSNQFGQPGAVTITRPTELCLPSAVHLGCCGPNDRCIETDGAASAGNGIPGAVEISLGAPLAVFPVAAPNNSGLGMFDNDGDGAWTFGFNGDDLYTEGSPFCPTANNDGTYDAGADCVVLDVNGSLFDGQLESCDLETGAACTPPLPSLIKYHDANGTSAWDDGEDIVLDVNGNGICD